MVQCNERPSLSREQYILLTKESKFSNCAINYLRVSTCSVLVGTAMARLPPFLVTHQALAMAMMSPHGFSSSPYLPGNDEVSF